MVCELGLEVRENVVETCPGPHQTSTGSTAVPSETQVALFAIA